MPWIAGIVALVGAGVSAYSSHQKDKALEQGEAIANRQAGIGAEDRATYTQLYAPRERQLLDSAFDASRTPAAEAARAGAEASKAADVSESITLRNARRSGININSPALASLTRRSQTERAGLVAAAKTYGRRYADDVNFSRQSAALDRGRNLTSNAMAANQSAAGLLSAVSGIRSQRDAAEGELYGQATGYIGAGLSDYLKGRKKPELATIEV